jgi:hypothetical protein
MLRNYNIPRAVKLDIFFLGAIQEGFYGQGQNFGKAKLRNV